MKRRRFLSLLPLPLTGIAPASLAMETGSRAKPVLTIAHITDVHIRPDEQVPQRFLRCLDLIKKEKIDFFLNTGDSIHAADYKDITRERVLEQWKAWDDCMQSLKNYDVYSCIGNHDPWWAAPSKDDAMYGVAYAAKRAGMPHRYYQFKKKNWHFIVLDGNNPGISLDQEQMDWLKLKLSEIKQGEFALLMSHYPILTVTGTFEGGQHKDHTELKKLFYQYKDQVKVCLSGHQHLLDRAWYNGVHYFCNGAMSGFWWGKGDQRSAAPYFYQETPPGYAILKLYADGTLENTYIPLAIE
ncbi:metallophosphoesterase [Flavihumibacter sp. CACIAM 22H1]|uniref:metallophosphoesterase family protein n=1 Tax=Flavihumibacter sp. CACIAM 22H1 TaxID=1812911 RepID=UPI0007A7DB99|nr:metallophosphoesterase [Flavihumibacter sp. CACIAM 22H1]KYP15280.1 MAG: metallophosphoesterase [Flavihumibacter sp. CACIAM 22H1]